MNIPQKPKNGTTMIQGVPVGYVPEKNEDTNSKRYMHYNICKTDNKQGTTV